MVEAEGLEPTTHSNKIKGGMWVCTREWPHNPLPPELLDAVRTWGRLPESLRTAVLAILRMGTMPISSGEGGQPVRRNSTSTGGADGLPIGEKTILYFDSSKPAALPTILENPTWHFRNGTDPACYTDQGCVDENTIYESACRFSPQGETANPTTNCSCFRYNGQSWLKLGFRSLIY